MRLIDADLLLERIYEYQSKAIETEDIIHSVKTLPTAYDMKKVVEEINKESAWYRGFLRIHTEEAIDIVRSGGVE